MFEDIFVGLVRCFFYATERQAEYSKIFYYRKNVWNLVMKLSAEDLLAMNLISVQKDEMKLACESHNFAPAKLRLVPKGDTFRPIMTFNRKIPVSNFEQAKNTMTVNKKLGMAHLALKNMKQKMMNTNLGFAVFQYEDIMKKYEAFVQKWKAHG